ncbi:MAG: ABC transporter ATP-binding protein [Deltaproteobacteria bacterium]|nr:ABC transporter ATP-binding protein [Deltaproteobacteria bacterium]
MRPESASVLAAFFFTAILAAATSGFAWLVGPLLRAVLVGQLPDNTGWLGRFLARVHPGPMDPASLLLVLPIGLVGLAAAKALAQFAQSNLLQAAGVRVTARLRRALYEKLLALPPAFFQDKHSGELFNRFTTDVANVELVVTQALVSYVKDTLTVVSLLVMCALLDLRLLGVLLAAVPLAAWPIARFAKGLKRIAQRSQGALGRVTERVSEVLSQMRVVQAYRQEGAELARFDSAQSIYLDEMRRSFLVRAAFTPILENLGVIGLALAIAVAARAIAQGALDSAHLLSFLAAAMLLYQPVKALSGTGQLVVTALASAERLFEILDADASPDSPNAKPLAPFTSEVHFENLTFSYGDKPVLRGLELTVRRGERVALVGTSGAGKSTLANLLLGFWRPTSGAIRVDGVDLCDATLASWRAQLALVTQEPVLFYGTVRENLMAARPGANEAELRDACQAAGALDFVLALPGGFDAPVGERGGLLSGGQRQRLALARALLRAAPILVLDEATSALDSESEQLVEQGVARLLEGRTAVIIAHRLSTIQRCDRIAVIHEGRVAEEGDHASLLAKNGLYAQLWQSFVGVKAA